MNANDLKKYSVIIGDGSGCLFQGMDVANTYILTAKHLFQSGEVNANDRKYEANGNVKNITVQRFDGNKWQEDSFEFTINFEVNFFPHPQPEVDAVILKIGALEGFDKIIADSENDLSIDFFLCGFPGRLRAALGDGDKYCDHGVLSFRESGNYYNIAQLDPVFQQDVINGMSGGGILKVHPNHIVIVGIQSRMASNAHNQVGQIGFIPIRYFEKIIEIYCNQDQLRPMLPSFLSSFKFFEDDIFTMSSGPLEKVKQDALAEVLRGNALAISGSDITPLAIKKFVAEKCLLLKKQNKSELQQQNIWRLWFELLVILNIARNRNHNLHDFRNLFNEFRFFYDDTNKDFLDVNIRNLVYEDYSDLGNGGLVVYASNVKSQSAQTSGVLNLNEILPNIGQTKKEYRVERSKELRDAGGDIGLAMDFPFDKYKYTNLSTFKEEIALNLPDGFIEDDIDSCYELLRKLYAKLIT